MNKNIRKKIVNNPFIKVIDKIVTPSQPKFQEDLLMFRKIALLLSGFFLILASGLFTACQCESPTQPPGNSPLSITNQTFTVAEDATNGTIIGMVNASDDSAITNYAITNGNTGNAFAINSSGHLTLITNLNYDTASNYTLTVEVTDDQSATASAIITVNVTDVDYPLSITNQIFTVAEDATNGTIIGMVNASDDSAITNYAITNGNTGNAFAINSSGRLSLISNLNYGTTSNYTLAVEVTDDQNATASAIITVNVIDALEWQTRYITNSITNDITANQITDLNQSTIIDGLKSKIFAWLDVSVSPLLIANSGNRLTNWLDKKGYLITGTNTDTTLSVTTNTNSQIETISNERVAFTNIVTTTNITLSLGLTNAVSATPGSDLSGNDSLSFQSGNNGYVDVDYEGDDRVGFAIDTTPMGSSDNITAFYLVTEWIQGNNSSHVPLGYSNLSEGSRFFTKANGNANYEPAGTRGVGNIVVGDSTFKRNANFSIPSGIHLLSRRGLSVSKSSLNGVLGSFPTTSLGGNQRFRELIVFTNAVTDTEHSNIIKYLHDKWSIPLQGITTNITSYYSASGGNPLNNAVDGDLSTYFQGDGAVQSGFTSNRILFEYRLYASVLDGGASALPLVTGVSTGTNSLYLRTGFNLNSDTLKAPFKVEVYRTNDGNWFVLSNVPVDNTSGDKEFIFALDHASNDFLGYRVVANGNISSGNWFTIDEFGPSSLSPGAPLVTAFSNTIANNKIYQTNEDIFLTGFTNYLYFDQAVYGLTTNDFVIENATILSFSAVNASNYLITVRPSPFYGGSNTNTSIVIQSPNLKVSLPEGAVTNASGSESPAILLLLDFVPRNPFSGFDAGFSSTSIFVDLNGNGDLDLISGETGGTFKFYRNNSGNFTEQTGGNNPLNGVDVGGNSAPSFVDLDGDGNLDLVSGEDNGTFKFYRNNSGNFTEQTGGNNPLDGIDVGGFSTPSFVDLDGDGDLDLISGETGGTFKFYRNNSGNFTEQTGGNNPLDGIDVGSYSTPSFVDLDGDGNLDLVSGEDNGTFKFYRNNSGNFTEQTGGNNPLDGFDVGGDSTPTFVDLDGDGDPDLVSGKRDGNFNFYMNIGGQFADGE